MSDFKTNLRELRLRRNLTQAELARHFELSRTTITHYESGKREPEMKFLLALSNFFDVTLDQLCGRTALPEPPDQMFPNSCDHAPSGIRVADEKSESN